MSITVDPIGVVLDILASGTKPIADEATKDFYHYLKSSFQSKFANNPKVQLALDEYEKEPDEELKALLTRQLKAANIDQDPEILKFLEKNPLQAATGNQNLQNFKSDTATTGATISKDNLSANRDAIKVGRDQVIHNRQSLLAVLLWLLALALTGVIGFGVYLFMTGRLQLPGQPAIPERGFNSEQPPAVAEQRVSLAALDSIQGGMTFEQVEEKLGVHLKLYSEMSYANTPFNSMYESMNIKGEAVYSCVLEDGSSFYFGFIQNANPDTLVLVKKATTPSDFKPPD